VHMIPKRLWSGTLSMVTLSVTIRVRSRKFGIKLITFYRLLGWKWYSFIELAKFLDIKT